MSTFVAVGNSKKSFKRLLDIVVENSFLLPQPVFVQNGYTEFSHREIRHSKFLSKHEFDRHVESSKIVISHGGAGALITCLKAGKKPIVLPRMQELDEHIDGHQSELVDALQKENKIYVLTETNIRTLLDSALSEREALLNAQSCQENQRRCISVLKSLLEELDK